VAQVARAVGIPVVVVVPEVNLADWENRQPPPLLAGDGNARWHRLYRQAVRRLGARRWEEVAALARGREDLSLASCRAEIDAASYATLCFLGTAVVRVDGVRIGVCDLDERWRRLPLRIDRRHLRPGLNRLTLEWPRLPATVVGERAMDTAIARLELGREADLYPVFGEFFSIHAS
jgi:hypothetical protein